MKYSRPIQKTLRLNKLDYYIKHLLIINPVLPVELTPKEAEVLANFMALEGDLRKDPFGTTGRKMVRKQMNISNGGLGNYLRDLKNKGFILETEDKELSILPFLIPDDEEQLYQFRLLKQEDGKK